MWTLHSVTENIKKYAIFAVVGIIILSIFWFILSTVFGIVFRPHIAAPDMSFGYLPPIPFPNNVIKQQLTYQLNTVDGKLDITDPSSAQITPTVDRLLVYTIIQPPPDLNSLEEATSKASAIGIVQSAGSPIQPQRISGTTYQWSKTDGYAKTIDFDISTFDFRLTSNYLTYPAVLAGENLPTDSNSVDAIQNFLNTMQLMPTDIDQDLTTISDLSIDNGTLVPANPSSQIQAIRVNFYQKSVNNITIVYPNPPDSDMSFLVTGGDSKPEIGDVTFVHQTPDLSPQGASTYPIKTPSEAYADLQQGKAYITPSFSGSTNQVVIQSISLGYYIGITRQQYLMPVYIFKGDNNFVAYVSAIRDNVVKEPTPTPAE